MATLPRLPLAGALGAWKGLPEWPVDGQDSVKDKSETMASQQLYSYLGRAGLWKNVSTKVLIQLEYAKSLKYIIIHTNDTECSRVYQR